MRIAILEKLPEPYKDCLYTETEIHFDFLDRLKILFGGIVWCKTEILVENPPEKYETHATVRVSNPIVELFPKKHIGYEAHNEDKEYE